MFSYLQRSASISYADYADGGDQEKYNPSAAAQPEH
jgi:hypothetical protein